MPSEHERITAPSHSLEGAPMTSIATQLVTHRTELNEDYQFVMRCQDGKYGALASEIAIDVVARETVEGDDPTPEVMADAIIAEARQTELDTLLIAA
jgi:hypothetical protein